MEKAPMIMIGVGILTILFGVGFIIGTFLSVESQEKVETKSLGSGSHFCTINLETGETICETSCEGVG